MKIKAENLKKNKIETEKRRPKTARHLASGPIKTYISQNLDDICGTTEILRENTNSGIPNLIFDKDKYVPKKKKIVNPRFKHLEPEEIERNYE
jgi:hypothetical protein